jgi:hypothetical protein
LKMILSWLKSLKIENERIKVYDQSYFSYKICSLWNLYFDIHQDFRYGPKMIPFLFYGVNKKYSLKMKLRFIINSISKKDRC